MTSIKGGGRASISRDIEEAIMELLMNLRDSKNPLLPKQPARHSLHEDQMMNQDQHRTSSTSSSNKNSSGDDVCGISDSYVYASSDHEKKRLRKKFLKNLLKCYQHQQLSRKLNQLTLSSWSNTDITDHSVDGDGKADVFHVSHPVDGKVRIEVTEAIFQKKEDRKEEKGMKKITKKESRKSNRSWKEGSIRKTMVLPRSTLIQDLMKLCKAKLQMKKPTQIFIVDKDSKLDMELTTDLSGIDDGALLYVTSHEWKTQELDSKPSKNGIVSEEQLEEQEDIVEDIDELEFIKKVYRIHGKSFQCVNQKVVITNEPISPFGPCLNLLEPLSDERAKLPVAAFRSEILKSLDVSRVLILSGSTGCGKSTQVPQYILEAMKSINQLDATNIIVTQPRRVAAMSLAQRVSIERKSPSPGIPDSEVGYNIRLSRAVSDSTKITFCTVGVLLRMLVNPRETFGDEEGVETIIPLANVSHVIIDEVHERDLNTDFALTLLKPLLHANKRISVILMSATASVTLFQEYFKDDTFNLDPIVLYIPGRTFPVQTAWLPDCERLIGSKLKWIDHDMHNNDDCDNTTELLSPRALAKIDNDFIKNLILQIASNEWNQGKVRNASGSKEYGSILVFLPGKGEIDSLFRTLVSDSLLSNSKKCAILKMHSSLSPSEQWRAFQPVEDGMVKIILSTNVAETSITIPDVTYVIDTGRAKEMRFNYETNTRDLVTVWISVASSHQRAGRGGRTGPGQVFKLYSEEFLHKCMPAWTAPEIIRQPLEDLVLSVCLMREQHSNTGIDPVTFLENAPQPPPTQSILQACEHLVELGALQFCQNNVFRLTPLGYHLAHLPMDAKIGKILVTGCILQCIEPALTIAAILSSPKTFWLDYIPGKDQSRDEARRKHETLIESGFGGTNWHGGSVKGDIICDIAAFDAWHSTVNTKHKRARKQFAKEYGLDHNVLMDLESLRLQFKDSLRISGLLSESSNSHGYDTLLTSCCLVAGLYPNISTLLRPSRDRKFRGGRLITKDGSLCKVSSESFQYNRMRNVNENGKDAYAVYHSKHRIVGVGNIDPKVKQDPFLSKVNFVSRFAIILFGGHIELHKNFLLIDGWLKFKIDDKDDHGDKLSDKCQINAILISELRKELDNIIVKQISKVKTENSLDTTFLKECEQVIGIVRMLLIQE